MQRLWDEGALTADALRLQLSRPLKDATVRTVLRRLEEKGYVSHVVEGRTFRYQSLHARSDIAAGIVRQVTRTFFGNSLPALLVGLVEASAIKERDLETAKALLRSARSRTPGRNPR